MLISKQEIQSPSFIDKSKPIPKYSKVKSKTRPGVDNNVKPKKRFKSIKSVIDDILLEHENRGQSACFGGIRA